MSMVFLVHADLSRICLIRSIAAISMLLSASFFGGLLKQIDQWFPKQAPVGIRILSGWVVALIAIQIAMSNDIEMTHDFSHPFQVVSGYEPAGDQPTAIKMLLKAFSRPCASDTSWCHRIWKDIYCREGDRIN